MLHARRSGDLRDGTNVRRLPIFRKDAMHEGQIKKVLKNCHDVRHDHLNNAQRQTISFGYVRLYLRESSSNIRRCDVSPIKQVVVKITAAIDDRYRFQTVSGR